MASNYSIIIEYSPAYELVMSLYAYLLKKEKAFLLGPSWCAKVARELPPAFAHELEDERWEVLHRIVLLIAQCPTKDSAEAFLHWLDRLPAGELYERLAPWVQAIPLDLGAIRDKSVSLLAQWHEHYFRSFDPAILRHLADESKRCAKTAESTPSIDLIEDVTNGMRIEPVDGLRQVILVPQYHCAPATVLDFFRGVATCLYPSRPAWSAPPHESLLQLAQCLADENRLRILHAVARKPLSLGELHKRMGLAKSTVHHHLTLLRRAGLIRSHFQGDTTPVYYSGRPGASARLARALDAWLHREGEDDASLA